MKEDEKYKYVCEIRRIEGMFEIECKKENEEEKKKIYCAFGTEGKTGGASALGFGGQYGTQEMTIECFREDEIIEKVARELDVKKEDIKWIREEETL